MKKFFTTISLFFTPFLLAQEQNQGLDSKINEAFTPIANAWGNIVLHKFPLSNLIFEEGIPTIIVLLVSGALFFTVYFGFINVRRFPLAIGVVSGKYDKLEKKSSKSNSDGEVSHFQALSTAVSGTVGNGNIAGVALAIAIGGPGATFWMIVCGLIGMSPNS